MGRAAISLPPGYQYFWYDEIDSTNLEAVRHSVERQQIGKAEDSWFCAKAQTGGRGTKGNEWISKSGNLYASLLCQSSCSPSKLSQISILAALAALEAIEQVASDNLHINDLCLKWPNDIILNGHKVCGILIESRPSTSKGLFDVIIGTGVNLCHSPELEGLFPAGNLLQNGWNCSRDQLFVALVRSTRDWLSVWRDGKGFETLRLAWLQRSCHIGQTITIRVGGTEVEGRFSTLSQEGAVVLEERDGTIRTISAGHLVKIGSSRSDH